MPSSAPRLSVIVTVVDGGPALDRCLAALAGQQAPPSLEILVPVDETATEASAIAARFPAVRVLALGRLPTDRPADSFAGQHELFDRRRAAGLAAATGELVAIVEDRGVPAADWARAMSDAHAALPHAVIGGAVACGSPSLLNQAVYFCDFGRYQPPFAPGPRPFVTDVNVCYKRAAIEATRALWAERYHETTVHWALARDGATLWLSPAPLVVQHRGRLALGPLLRERFAWARLFAWTRGREVSAAHRWLLAALTPLLPAVLYLRHLRGRLGGHDLGRFLLASPAIVLLLAAWSAGEAAGCLGRRP